MARTTLPSRTAGSTGKSTCVCRQFCLAGIECMRFLQFHQRYSRKIGQTYLRDYNNVVQHRYLHFNTEVLPISPSNRIKLKTTLSQLSKSSLLNVVSSVYESLEKIFSSKRSRARRIGLQTILKRFLIYALSPLPLWSLLYSHIALLFGKNDFF